MKSNIVIACALFGAVLSIGCLESNTASKETNIAELADELPPLPPEEEARIDESTAETNLNIEENDEELPPLPE